MRNTIIYLIGHYGVGKLTIGREICAATGARLFDNHLANNVIFSLVREDGATPLPQGVWPLIMTIRRQALSAMANLAGADASFVLTNALMDDDPMDPDDGITGSVFACSTIGDWFTAIPEADQAVMDEYTALYEETCGGQTMQVLAPGGETTTYVMTYEGDLPEFERLMAGLATELEPA